MKSKAIIFDLDGTAINSPDQKLPSNRLIEACIKLGKDHFLCAATGRSWTFAKPVLQALRLEDFSIIAGGTQICDPQSGLVSWQENIPQQSLSQILTVFSQNPEYKLIFNDYSEEDYFNGGVLPKDITFTQKIHWMSQIFVPDEIAIKTHADLEAIPGITCVMVVSQKPGKRDLHVVSETATKEHAIGRLLNQLGVQRENAIGVGDGHNDIDLFNAVGTKVAMGNAVEDLKKAADVIIGTVEEDGLAQYFKTLLEA